MTRQICAMWLMLIAAGCGEPAPGLVGTIKIDGSSTVFPLTSAVVESFVKKHGGVKISVGVSGTGGGFEKFCRNEIEIHDASRPITARERDACDRVSVNFIEVPVAYDAVTIVVHPQNDWATSMTMAELKRLWEPAAEGSVMRWRDVRPGWPDEPIRLFGPGALSGTFDFFTETVTGTLDASRKDYTASEDDTVIVNGVAADRLALGYVGYGYVEQNRNALRPVAIAGANADRLGPVRPSPENVQRGAYAPLARTLFIYVNANALQRPEVSAFVDFYLEEDEDLVRSVGGIAMSHRAYELVRARVAKRVAGTLFTDNRATDNLEMLLAASVGAESPAPSRR